MFYSHLLYIDAVACKHEATPILASDLTMRVASSRALCLGQLVVVVQQREQR